MNDSNKPQISNELKNTISSFLAQYGILGLKQALQLYRDTQHDIYYMEIQEHHITIFTQHGTYHKYGTLNNEW